MFKKIYLYLFLIMIYLPLTFVVLWSFNSSSHKGNILSIFNHLTFDNYHALVHNSSFLKSILLTTMISLIAMFFSVVISFNIILTMRRHNNKMNNFILKTLNWSIALPDIITGLMFLLLILIVLTIFNIHQGLLAAIIINIVFNIPYALLTMWPRMKKMDHNLFSASHDLGAKKIGTLFNVVIPYMMPAIVGACAITFMMSFDDFVITKFAIGNHYNTISTIIYSMSKGIKAYTLAFSSIVIIGLSVISIVRAGHQYYLNKKRWK